MGKNKTKFRDETKTRDKNQVREPPFFKVLLHNDDYTTMDFVIQILETVFQKNKIEATQIMLNVHHQGIGIAGVYTHEIGETKVAIVHAMARKNQFPLKCSLEKVD